MKFVPTKDVKKFQQGGEMTPAEQPAEEAPVDGGGQDPMMMLAEAAAQALQSQDCQIAMQVCQGLMALVEQMAGGAPQEASGEPVFAKKGAKLQVLRRVKR